MSTTLPLPSGEGVDATLPTNFVCWTGFYNNGSLCVCAYKPGLLALFEAEHVQEHSLRLLRQNAAFPYHSPQGTVAWVQGQLLFTCPELSINNGVQQQLQIVFLSADQLDPVGTAALPSLAHPASTCLKLFSDGALLYTIEAPAQTKAPLRQAQVWPHCCGWPVECHTEFVGFGF